MKIVELTNGNKIIASNSCILYDENSDLVLKVDTENNFKFTIKIVFNKDTSGEMSIRKMFEGDNIVIYDCVNFNNTLGTGTTQAIEVGRINSRRILIHFWVYALGDEGLKRVDYTMYEEIGGSIE